MSKPRVSVLIDTYNHERYIEQAITSVLEQDFPMSDVEVLVVDDGSTDRTPEIVRKFEPRLRLLRKTNGGQASAFNFALPECRGEIIALLDGDDWWARQKLGTVVDVFGREPKVGIVGHGVTESFSDGREHTESLKEPATVRIDSPQAAEIFRVRKSFLGTSRMTLRSNLVPHLLPIPETLRFEADEYLFTVAATISSAFILCEPLTFYRIHESNLFQMQQFSEDGCRCKSQVLACLANSLDRKLGELGLHRKTRSLVIECVYTEADQLRLMVEAGYPWETVRAELKSYQILYHNAGLAQWIFKCASLIPALVLTPRLYYRSRRWISTNNFYLRVRKGFLPIPEVAHTVRTTREML